LFHPKSKHVVCLHQFHPSIFLLSLFLSFFFSSIHFVFDQLFLVRLVHFPFPIPHISFLTGKEDIITITTPLKTWTWDLPKISTHKHKHKYIRMNMYMN
jgi:hypothetical protein